jgi:hypothetical protein
VPVKRPWILGLLAGQIVWALSYVAARSNSGAVFDLIAAPVMMLGWLLIWGDGPGRLKFVETTTFTVIFGLRFYGLVGGVAAMVIARLSRRRI